MYIDTHCHLNMMVAKNPDELLTKLQIIEIGAVVAEAEKHGVTRIINVGTSIPESLNSIALARHYSSVYATVGVHPCDVTSSWRNDVAMLRSLLSSQDADRIVGVGETGLDFYHKPYDVSLQTSLFKAQIELAIEYDRALVVHIRDAGDEALKILQEYKKETRGVIHCFSLDMASAQEVTSWGNWYIGIDGPVTYPKNEWLREVTVQIDLSYQLLETDAPFLTPQPKRGKKNSPVYLPMIAEQMAQSRCCSCEEIAQATTNNAQRLFGIE